MKTTILTVALFAMILVGMLGIASLAAIAPWWCLPMIVVGGFKFGSASIDLLHMVHGITID